MLEENKWLAARHGLEGELVDLPTPRPGRDARELARRLLDRLRPHAQDLGSRGRTRRYRGHPGPGNGADRQLVVYEANHDLQEVMAEIVAATAP